MQEFHGRGSRWSAKSRTCRNWQRVWATQLTPIRPTSLDQIPAPAQGVQYQLPFDNPKSHGGSQCPRPSRSPGAERITSQSPTVRPATERVLRDIAFVLKLTQRVGDEIRAEVGSPKPR